MKTKILFLGMFLCLLSVSCTKTDDETTPSAMTAADAGVNAKMNASNDDVSKIVEDQFQATADNATTGRMEPASTFLTCATITRVPAFGTAPTVGQTITKTIVFDPAGCTLPNGNVLKGTIIISFPYQPTATTHTITYQFVNFYHNAIKYEGNKIFTWVWGTSAFNANSHAIVTMDMDMTATFPNGSVYHRTGSRLSEIISGGNTPGDWTDNIYRVTGNWDTVFPDGIIRNSEITTALIVKMECFNSGNAAISEGIITFHKNGLSSTLDYGNGDCDNIAIFTIYGIPFTINVGHN
jgi:hypothetical protein